MKKVKYNLWKNVPLLMISVFLVSFVTQANASIIYIGNGEDNYTFLDYSPKTAVSGSTIQVTATGYEWDEEWEDIDNDGIADRFIGAYQDFMFGETTATVFGSIGQLVPVTVFLLDSISVGGFDDFIKEERVLVEIVGAPTPMPAPSTLYLLAFGIVGLYSSKKHLRPKI
jgi:hypothetical protein